MACTRSKSQYLKRVELTQFCQRHGQVWLLTMTFAENILEKAEAQKRWKPVADWLARRGIEQNGVWQRQTKRGKKNGDAGAWHYHTFINKRIDIVEFRKFAVGRGWGTFINVEVVGQHNGYRSHWTTEGAIAYVCRYLTRDYCVDIPARVRLSGASNSTKCGTTRFRWVGGLAKVWRLGCQSLGYVPNYRDYKAQTEAWRYGCIVAGLDYVQVMHQLLGIAPAQKSTA